MISPSRHSKGINDYRQPNFPDQEIFHFSVSHVLFSGISHHRGIMGEKFCNSLQGQELKYSQPRPHYVLYTGLEMTKKPNSLLTSRSSTRTFVLHLGGQEPCMTLNHILGFILIENMFELLIPLNYTLEIIHGAKLCKDRRYELSKGVLSLITFFNSWIVRVKNHHLHLIEHILFSFHLYYLIQ